MSTKSVDEEKIIQIAFRETSAVHASEFDPITRGPFYACLALLPLCILAAVRLVWLRVRQLAPGSH